MAMDDIFQTLSHFEGRVQIVTPQDSSSRKHREARVPAEVKESLEKIVARVIVVFSEALRLRSVYKEVLKRLTVLRWQTASTLDSRLWFLIKDWGQASDHVHDTLQQEGTLDDLGAALPSKFSRSCGFPTMTMSDLIGPGGELMVVKMNEVMQRFHGQDGAANVKEPGFPVP